MSELPDNNSDEARRWLGQAAEDLAAAHLLLSDEIPGRIACFHAHLAVEKALKAWLIWVDTPFPKTHDLGDLRALLPESLAREIDEADLELLEPWVIDGRYPGNVPDLASGHALRCVEAAQRTVDAVAARVGRS